MTPVVSKKGINIAFCENMIARAERYQVDCPVQFTHEGDDSGEGRVINISLNGCAIRSSARVEEGDLIALQLELAPTAQIIQIEMARVRWAKNDEFGIEFLFTYEKERKVLLRFLRTIAVQFIH
ncbi:MAG TPA: PilZ domain-containing protein [Nitrospira sp.]|nr:PilZ domain-containing protein [Nitrospira sp.]